MFGRWDCQLEFFALFAVIDEGLVVTVADVFFDLFVGDSGPVEGVAGDHHFIPCGHAKVMNGITTANDEDAFASQGCKFFGERVVVCGRLCIVEAQLYNGDIGVWIEEFDDCPATVIESPILVETYLCRFYSLLCFFGQGRTTGCGVLHIV